MSEITPELDIKEKALDNLCHEWARDHNHLIKLCEKYGFSEKEIHGDSYGVPGIQELADLLDRKIQELIPLAAGKLLDDIFDEKYTWRGKKLFWCDLCGTWAVKFDCCKNSSCNCGGCEKCNEESREFSNDYKSWPEYYLTNQEMNIVNKYKAIKKFIPICLEAGFKEINFKYLDEKGLISIREENLLKMLEIKKETVSDGFGGEWNKVCPMCGDVSIHVIRPGKVQCYNCD